MTRHILSTPAETARELVRYILQTASQVERNEVNIALSGGSTPALMFDIWADEFAAQTPWQRLRLCGSTSVAWAPTILRATMA